MADEAERDEAPAKPRPDPTPGAVLRAARREQGRTTRDIAATLNMDAWMLDAIERDEYSALGAPVFAKGHLRKYAVTLGVDPDELMVGYYELSGPREAPPLIADSILRAEAARPTSFAWVFPTVVVAAAIVTLAAVALWYLRTEPTAAVPAPETAERGEAGDGPVPLALPATDAEAPASDSLARRSVTLPPAETVAAPPDDSPAASANAGAANGPSSSGGARGASSPRAAADAPGGDAAASAAEPAAEAPAPPPVDNLRLTLRFRTDSWVEVYDAQRRKMLYGMGEAGTTRNLSGLAPLQVFLGRYAGVDIEVNGEPFTIPRAARRTNTARFRIEQPSG